MKIVFSFLIAFMVLAAATAEACTTVQAGIFANGTHGFVVKAKVSVADINNMTFDRVVVTVYWEKSLPITLGAVNSPFGIAPSGAVGTEGIYYYQKFVGCPGGTICWPVNSVEDLFTVDVSGAGPAIFGLFNPADPCVHGRWRFVAGGEDLTNTVTPFFATPTDEIPLPVSLTSFAGYPDQSGRGVRLEWKTLSEVNNYGFTVQRKTDADGSFVDLANAFIAGKGTTVEPQLYSYIDHSLTKPGIYGYRLKQQDLDGTMHYSSGVVVNVATTAIMDNAPVQIQLLQNYPNPFNPSTQVKFSVDATTHASLKIYNALGEDVATLFDGVAEAGQYYVTTFSGQGLPSGVYFCELTTGTKSDLKRMMLLR